MTQTSGKPLAGLRQSIDAIDEKLLALINQRLKIAREIGAVKRREGSRVIDPQRESQLISRLMARNEGPLSKENLYHVFKHIITISRAVQTPQSADEWGPGVAGVYAVIGDPVVHSLSPVMHNRALAHTGVNGIYIALRVTDIAAAVNGFRTLGFKGLSVTIPHKMTVMGCLDEVDATARDIGAVNTIVNRNGRLAGYNSDYLGAVKALGDAIDIGGKTVVIIGAGGAACAIGFGVVRSGGRVVILNRSPQKGEQLAGALNADFQPLSETREIRGQVLVNTTPVGMFPHAEQMPIDKRLLRPDLVVMDIIYNPLTTRLLSEAARTGCRTINGLSMFVYQGAVQFELWTGEKAPLDVMREAVESALQRV
ncbi:MAG: shikimate dehydrogenase [Desulfobacterales bacterium]